MNWRIEYTQNALNQLKRIDKAVATRIEKYLDERIAGENNPRRFGTALKSNLAGLWKYRVGDYRIICEIQDTEIIVLVIDIGHRSKIYGGH